MKYSAIFLLALLGSQSLLAKESEGMRAMRLGCEKHKVALGCFNYANMLVRSQKEGADKYYALGCKLKHQGSCAQEKWDIPERKVAIAKPIILESAVEESESLVESEAITPNEESEAFVSLEEVTLEGEHTVSSEPSIEEELIPITSESLGKGVSVIGGGPSSSEVTSKTPQIESKAPEPAPVSIDPLSHAPASISPGPESSVAQEPPASMSLESIE